MKLQKIIFSLLCIIFTCSAHADDRGELKARFEKRYPEILEYKTQGKIGETMQGLIEAVDPKYLQDEKLAKLIDEENADRNELYKAVAAKENTTEQTVANRTARRNYEKARPGDYLKTPDNKWERKK